MSDTQDTNKGEGTIHTLFEAEILEPTNVKRLLIT